MFSYDNQQLLNVINSGDQLRRMVIEEGLYPQIENLDISQEQKDLMNHDHLLLENTVHIPVNEEPSGITGSFTNIVNDFLLLESTYTQVLSESEVEHNTVPQAEMIEGDGEDPYYEDPEAEAAAMEEEIENESKAPAFRDDPEANPTHEGEEVTTADMSEEELAAQQQEEVQLTPDEVLSIEISQTKNKFTTVILYQKIIDTINKIDTIVGAIRNNVIADKLDFIEKLESYKSYLEILNELIFVLDINTIYYNVAIIQIELTELIEDYLVNTKMKKLQSGDLDRTTYNDEVEELNELQEKDADTIEETL